MEYDRDICSEHVVGKEYDPELPSVPSSCEAMEKPKYETETRMCHDFETGKIDTPPQSYQ